MKNYFTKFKNCLIVAEISSNHAQNFKRAVESIKKAKECGADAVKFQTYLPDALTMNNDSKYFRIKHPKWGGQTLHTLYEKSYTPWAWFKKLKKVADDIGIIFFSTAFDKNSVDLLENIKIPFHKVASFELVDLPLIEYMSRTGKPIILSTGMASLQEIREAVCVARKSGAKNILLLKCISSYPAMPEEMNLRTIDHMSKIFKCPVGLSDHTLGTCVPVTAVSMGACLIEKHFTLSRAVKTPDSFFSIEPRELKELVTNVRMAEKAIGKIHYGLTREEKSNRIFRRSLFTVKDISKGEKLSYENVKSIRPANGLKPKYLGRILGKKVTADVKAGTPLTWRLINK